MKPLQQLKVPDDPDVLAWDPALRRLYVAAESGVLSVFWLDGAALKPAGQIRAPHAQTVSVDPRTHRVYLPLENINGHPVLRIYEPAPHSWRRPRDSVRRICRNAGASAGWFIHRDAAQ
jgi:6-phosphogluconolactonase (cycloisomerase 2 family)